MSTFLPSFHKHVSRHSFQGRIFSFYHKDKSIYVPPKQEFLRLVKTAFIFYVFQKVNIQSTSAISNTRSSTFIISNFSSTLSAL